MEIKRLASLAVCAAVSAGFLCSCSGKGGGEAGVTTTAQGIDDGVEPVVQETPSYSFPSFFIDNKDDISLYSNLIYSSFDSPVMNVALSEAEQKFDSIVCEMSFRDGEYYSYVLDGKRGLVNADGSIMLSASYAEIALVRPDTFLLRDEAGEEKYAYIEESGVVTVDEDGSGSWFTGEQPVQIKITDDTESGTTSYYLESARGRTIYNKYWDYIEPVLLDISSIAAYSAYDGDAYYYIVFDKYYNYKVYEGSYATVELFVDGQYGSCFVLSNEDYNEISSMINSFGATARSVSAPTDPNADYVKFVFGGTKLTVTLSEDGFCYTEEIGAEDGISRKYFTIVDRLCFSDVVNWIDTKLSQEYVR